MAKTTATPCQHFELAQDVTPKTDGCEECLREGRHDWVALRMCMVCGHVGCCDSSPGKHATAHFHETAHPIMRSIEPGQDWRWCYIDELMVQ